MRIFFSRVVVLLLFILPATVKSQTAAFTADYVAGCAPLLVHFTNTTGCPSCTYYWDLGNGTTSTLTDVSGSYITAGTYTVSLTAHNGAVTTVDTMSITVYPQPTVNFTADDTSVCPGVPVVFTSTSIAGVPGPMTYMWNFGDGDSSTLATLSHVYNVPGFYNITLAITNAQGCVSSLTRAGYMHIFSRPVPNFVATPTSSCTTPATVAFSNSSTGTGNTYTWSFGDGGTSSLAAPSHTYTVGAYTVKMVATSADGCKDSLTRPSYINVGNLAATFTESAVCLNSPVTFTNTSTPHVWSSWNFGDGGSSTAESPVHTYTAIGTYTVTLVVSDGPCYSTATHVITVHPMPAGTFTITPERPCPAPVALTFNSTVSPGASAMWKYGDGTGTGISSVHTYTANGAYTMTMIVNDTYGCKDSVAINDTIYNLLHPLDIPNFCDTLSIQFFPGPFTTTPSGYMAPYPYTPFTYVWNYGDGSPADTGATPWHTYSVGGSYLVSVTMTSDNGCSLSRTDTVFPGIKIATFTVSPLHVCYNQLVTFKPTVVSGPISYYAWEFGDGGNANSFDSVQWTHLGAGAFVATLTPVYKGCMGRKFVTSDTILVDSPKAILSTNFPCNPRSRVEFTSYSIGADSVLWFFGDGGTSTLPNPAHDYPAMGSYSVTLTTYNIKSGCRDTTKNIVRTIDLTPKFTANDTTICKGDTVKFLDTILGGTAEALNWYINGGYAVELLDGKYHRVFDSTGLFNVMLVTTDPHGCFDTAIRNNYILVAKPTPGFVSGTSGCLPYPVAFTDTSRDITGTTLTSFIWNFGDGIIDTAIVPSISHTYTVSGNFSVKEIVTDNIGCKDSITKVSYVHVHKPHAFFYASTIHPCPGTTVSFTNVSAGITSSFWRFGDGATATTISPDHIYTATGTYTITLAVTDSFGCHDTAVTVYTVTKPKASFTMSDSFAICYPHPINFTNTSLGAATSSWLFGDSNSSVLTSPSNIYITPGLFNVRLIAADVYGCTDTADSHVNIYGYAGAFSYTPVSGCSPVSVHFVSSVHNATSITWDFADGITATTIADSTDHIYTLPGAYVPKLILSDNTGCANSSTGLDTIKIEQIIPNFTALPAPVCAGSPLNFVDSSITRWSSVSAWSWAYDGTTSTLAAPAYTYTTAGTHPVTLTVTNGWGCTATITKMVTINPLPVIITNPDTVICAGDTAMLYVSGGSTYTWAAGTSLSCITCDTLLVTPTVSATYTVTGTDAFGCINGDTTRISFLEPITGDSTVCRGNTITLHNTATAGKWHSSSAAIAAIDSLTGIITAISPGTATITFTLPAGCFTTAMVTVYPSPGPVVGSLHVCTGNTVTLSDTVAGGIWISGSPGAATIDSFSGTVTGISPGTSVITYALGSCNAFAIVTASVTPPPIENLTVCAGATATLSDAMGGGTWSSGATGIATIGTGGVLTGITPGTANITYSLGGSCYTSAIATVDALPFAGIITGSDSVCKGASITLSDTVAGGTWSSSNAAIASIDSSGIVTGNSEGSAVITYTTPPNSAGCINIVTLNFTVIQPAFTVSPLITNVKCYGGSDGNIAVAINGGAPPFAYEWQNGKLTPLIDSLSAGLYTVKITETKTQCAITDTFTVNMPDSLELTPTVSNDSCNAGGSIKVTVKGGTVPYTYAWFNGSITPLITGLPPGSYTVAVTDSNGCIKTLGAIVGEDSCVGIVIHDVITPNGDGVNDVWVIEGLHHYPDNAVYIFDKWGNEVFEKAAYANDWYGKSKDGPLLPDGTYYYLIKLNAPNQAGGKNTFTGSLLIKR